MNHRLKKAGYHLTFWDDKKNHVDYEEIRTAPYAVAKVSTLISMPYILFLLAFSLNEWYHISVTLKTSEKILDNAYCVIHIEFEPFTMFWNDLREACLV